MADTLRGVIRWGALPVPYVAAWSSESAMRIAPDPRIGDRPALFRDGRRGLGKPLFGKMSEARTRQVVVEQRCQVCARQLAGDGYVCDVAYATLRGRYPILHEPPACARCFQVAVTRCPGIAQMQGRPRLLVARVRRYEVVLVSLAPAAQGDADMNAVLAAWRGVPPVGYARPALIDYDLVPLPAVLAAGGR